MEINKIYVISDTHFGHEKMIKEWGIRSEDFNDRLWKGLDKLPDNAILIHCGDICIGYDATTHLKLQKYKFKKWLIRGNHDNHSITWYIRNGWDMVCDELVIDMFGGKIIFSHFPLPKREGIIKNIHGHLHNGKSHGYPDFYDKEYHIEISPEVIGYSPILLK